MRSKKGVLLENTIMLYIMTFSNYFFALITVPYQTRIFGPEIYGTLGFAQAFVIYFQMLIDFGFMLSATADISKKREDKAAVSKILSSVIGCKLLLSAFSFVILLILCLSLPVFRADVPLYMLCFLSCVVSTMLPDFLYRGLEKMSIITYRAVAVRLFFTLAIFVFLRRPEQYYLVPILNIIGTVGAGIVVYSHVYRRLGIRFVRISFSDLRQTLKTSFGFFLSRIATTVYGATNTFVLGLLYPGSAGLGYYTSAEKLIQTARSAFSPISDSLYPYMVKNKDFKMVKKVLLLVMPVVILGCTVVWIFAEPFCALFFGEEFRPAGKLLRLLLPIVVITLPTYIFGFPVLSPMGLAKYANSSVIVAAILHGIMLLVLFLTGWISVETVCIATFITEATVLGQRIYIILKMRKKSNFA